MAFISSVLEDLVSNARCWEVCVHVLRSFGEEDVTAIACQRKMQWVPLFDGNTQARATGPGHAVLLRPKSQFLRVYKEPFQERST